MNTMDKVLLLIPVWDFTKNDKPDNDIPPYFMKAFSSKKEIAEYLTANDIEKEMRDVKNTFLGEWAERTGEDPKETLKKMMSYDRITFWVITVNPVGKENRIGIMERKWNRNTHHFDGWHYVSYFGGKVWKDNLLFGIYR